MVMVQYFAAARNGISWWQQYEATYSIRNAFWQPWADRMHSQRNATCYDQVENVPSIRCLRHLTTIFAIIMILGLDCEINGNRFSIFVGAVCSCSSYVDLSYPKKTKCHVVSPQCNFGINRKSRWWISQTYNIEWCPPEKVVIKWKRARLLLFWNNKIWCIESF